MTALLEYYFTKFHSELSLKKNKYSVISMCRDISLGVYSTHTQKKFVNSNQKIV